MVISMGKRLKMREKGIFTWFCFMTSDEKSHTKTEFKQTKLLFTDSTQINVII